MATLDIVEVVDVVADGSDSSGARWVAFVVNELGAQRRKEAFGDGIVPAVALAAHAPAHVVGLQLRPIGVAGVGAAAVRMMQEPWQRPPRSQRLSKHVESQGRVVAL